MVWFPSPIYAETSGRRFLARYEAADDFFNNFFFSLWVFEN